MNSKLLSRIIEVNSILEWEISKLIRQQVRDVIDCYDKVKYPENQLVLVTRVHQKYADPKGFLGTLSISSVVAVDDFVKKLEDPHFITSFKEAVISNTPTYKVGKNTKFEYAIEILDRVFGLTPILSNLDLIHYKLTDRGVLPKYGSDYITVFYLSKSGVFSMWKHITFPIEEKRG